MKATEVLRNDHGVLRTKLTLLEGLLPLAAAPQAPVRTLMSTLARCLCCHTEKEEFLLAVLQERLSKEARATTQHLFDDHQAHSRTLALLLERLEQGERGSAEQTALSASQLISHLREHMATEEATLFPELDQLLSTEQTETVVSLMRQVARCYFLEDSRMTPRDPGLIREDMTVNHVIRTHPLARQIFTAFQIDWRMDGGLCLDELVWRRGVDVEALLLAFNQSLGEPAETVPVPGILWNSCDGMMVIDAHRRVLAMNPALERLIGWRIRDVAGQRECGVLFACQDLQGCRLEDRPTACPGLRAMRWLKPIKAAEYTILTVQGRRVPVSASYTPIQMGPHGPTWALVVMRDIKLQKRRERRLAHQAMTDSLTGLPNRAGLFDAFGRELKRASRHARRLAVAMVDLDGFKAYNDAYGHLAGDALLKAVAGLLPLGLRATDFVARYGGDEFLLLLPETDAAGAMIMAKHLCQMVAEFPFAKSDALPGAAPPIPVTISAGLAVFPDNGSSHEALIGYADRRLFEAKQQGRSQVVGSPNLTEHRRKPRVTLECPVTVRRLAAAPHEAWPDAVLKNISPIGAYFTTESHGQSTMTDDMLLLSLSILPGQQQNLPFSRFAGQGRVMRIEELGHVGSAGQQRVGIAVEFTEEATVLPISAHNGSREQLSERRQGGSLAWAASG